MSPSRLEHSVSLPAFSSTGQIGPLMMVASPGSRLKTVSNETDASSRMRNGRSIAVKNGHSLSWPKIIANGKSHLVETTSAPTPIRNDIQHHDRIIFGTAAIAKADKPLELLDAAYEKGFRRFDLAYSYGGGASERIFGTWMESRGIDRSSVDIITKGGMGEDKYGDPNRPVLTRETLQAEVNASLDKLRTDSVDLYLFHRDDPRIDVSQFVLWANELVDSGKAHQWGVSNWSFERFRQAYEFAMDNDLEPPCANSPQFSLAVPKCEVWPTTESISGPQYAKQLEWYEDNDIELLCWEVLAKGFMAKPHLWSEDTVDPSTFYTPFEIGSDEWRLQRIQRAYCNDRNYRRRRVAMQQAKRLGYKLSQIVMLYILSMGKNISVLFGSTNLEHIDDMVGLCDCQLDEEANFRLASLNEC